MTYDELRTLFNSNRSLDIPYPGNAWLGDQTGLLPWAFQQYQSEPLVGRSVNAPNPLTIQHAWDWHPSGLNVALSSNTIANLNTVAPQQAAGRDKTQLATLLELLSGPYVSLAGSWKLLTVSVGPNDICNSCGSAGGPATGADSTLYLRRMAELLTSIAAAPQLTKTIVTVIAPLNVTLQRQFTDSQCAFLLANGTCALRVDICAAVRSSACPCLSTPERVASMLQWIQDVLAGLPVVVAQG